MYCKKCVIFFILIMPIRQIKFVLKRHRYSEVQIEIGEQNKVNYQLKIINQN